jgi:hypothetical protein
MWRANFGRGFGPIVRQNNKRKKVKKKKKKKLRCGSI